MTPADLTADPGFAALRDYLVDLTGMAFYRRRQADLATRLGRRLWTLDMAGCAAYLRHLRGAGDATALDEVADLLAIGETYFFRHPEQLDALVEVAVPDAMARARARGDRCLRLWSAGCATGPEPYSLAILLRQRLGAALSGWDLTIVGTDMNPRFLEVARRAVYSEHALRRLPPGVRETCFRRGPAGWELAEPYRRDVTFRLHNLARQADRGRHQPAADRPRADRPGPGRHPPGSRADRRRNPPGRAGRGEPQRTGQRPAGHGPALPPVTDLHQRLLAAFGVESQEHLAFLRQRLQAGDLAAQVGEAFRRAHSLKGAARAVDLAAVETLAHRLESLLARDAALLVVQHMAPAFLRSFASWLGGVVPQPVRLAAGGQVPAPGTVYVAPAAGHLVWQRGRLALDDGPAVSGQKPSGTVLLRSLAACDRLCAGAVLTGMGDDGAEGLLAMHRAGHQTFAESEASAVVYGMPARAVDLGAARHVLPLTRLAADLRDLRDLACPPPGATREEVRDDGR